MSELDKALKEILEKPIMLPESHTGDAMVAWIAGYSACLSMVTQILNKGGGSDVGESDT